jgi:hypothetical protein
LPHSAKVFDSDFGTFNQRAKVAVLLRRNDLPKTCDAKVEVVCDKLDVPVPPGGIDQDASTSHIHVAKAVFAFQDLVNRGS